MSAANSTHNSDVNCQPGLALNVVIRNLNESANENVKEKVNTLVNKALKVTISEG